MQTAQGAGAIHRCEHIEGRISDFAAALWIPRTRRVLRRRLPRSGCASRVCLLVEQRSAMFDAAVIASQTALPCHRFCCSTPPTPAVKENWEGCGGEVQNSVCSVASAIAQPVALHLSTSSPPPPPRHPNTPRDILPECICKQRFFLDSEPNEEATAPQQQPKGRSTHARHNLFR